ncbi:MAG: small multi-drug export protein [Lachnospiraceae bacterium]|nr:small multi-drug export protein [Lachnospiraceae bacterium]
MVPVVELRGGLILAPIFGMNIWKAILICLAGNIVPVPIILLFITKIFSWLKTTRLLKGFAEKLEAKAMNKSEKIARYEFWGLVLFVGIPLPGTGAWTGCLIAALLGIKLKKAFPAVIIGLLIATTIMCTITYGIPALFG